MTRFLDFLIIISVMTWLLGLGLVGALSVEATAAALVALVVLLGLVRRLGLSIAGLLLRVGIVAASLATLVILNGGWTPQATTGVLKLAVVLFGLYLVVAGLRTKPRGTRD